MPAFLTKLLSVYLCTSIYANASAPNSNKDSNQLCFTKDCLTIAANLLQNMDPEVDPCEDFYKFACGKFADRVYVDEQKIVESTQSLNRYQYLAELKHLLDTPKLFSEPETVWKAKDFFFACLNSTEDNDDTLPMFLEDLGGLPLLAGEMWDENNFDWFDMTTYLHRVGFNDFGVFGFRHFFEQDQLAIYPSEAIINNLILPQKYSRAKFGLEIYDNLTIFINEFIGFLGADEKAKHTDEIRKVLELVSEINQGHHGESSKMTISDLQRLVPWVNWRTTIQRLYNKKISHYSIVYVMDLQRLQRTLAVISTFDKRTVANYILLNLLLSLYNTRDFNSFLQSKVKTAMNVLNKYSDQDVDLETPHLVHCIEQAGIIYGAASYLYFKKYLDYDMQGTILKMESTIRNQLIKSLERAKTLDGGWKDGINKLKRNLDADVYIGSGDKYLDDIYLDQLYAELPSQRNDHFANVLAMKKYRQRLKAKHHDSFKDVLNSYHLIKGLRGPPVTYAGSAQNGIEYTDISPLLMRGIAFSNERSASLNFAFLGVKIMEGLIAYLDGKSPITAPDSQNSRNVVNKFQEMRRCVIRQFDSSSSLYPEANYVMKSTTDKSYLSTNMVEQLIAVTTAYDAFKKWDLQYDQKYPLPGIDVDKNQLFWLGYATSQCDAYDEEMLSLTNNPPSFPNRITLLHVLRNSPSFSEDFNCPTHSYMNAPNKCELTYE